jgi:integrase
MSLRKIRIRQYRSVKRPHLKFYVGYREAGKRKRSFFETRAAAESFAAFKNRERHRNGIEHSEFPTALRIMAHECWRTLQDFGKTIKDATDFYVTHLRATEKSCTAVQLVTKILAAKKADGLSSRHLDDLQSRLSVFAKRFDGKPVSTIEVSEIDDWLRSLPVSPVTRNNYRKATKVAFNFAIKRGYALTNPVLATEKAREPKIRPGILSIEQASALLTCAAPEIVPYIAIGLFAGLRRAEIERLDWSEIDFDDGHIEVTAEKSKSKVANRFITIQPNLREWLEPFRKLRGPVTPRENFRFLLEQSKSDAGIASWPQNALRHSFASYHVAHFRDAKGLALEMGHANSGILFNHYRALVKPKEAARYWNLKPVPSGEQKIVAISS